MTILCGTDFPENSDTATRVAFRRDDSTEPLQTRRRAQAEGLRQQFAIDVQPLVERGAVLLRDVEQWAGEQPRPGDRSFIVKPGWGRADSHLTQLAEESKVDLIVVGTQQRAGIARLWQGSVPRGVPMSVACVPLRGAGDKTVETP